MFSNKSNDNFDMKFHSRSTPKKSQSNNDNNDRKMTTEVVFSELQTMKDENGKQFDELFSRLEKAELKMNTSTDYVLTKNYENDEQRKAKDIAKLDKRLSKVEIQISSNSERLVAIEKFLMEINNELKSLQVIQTKSTIEDIVEKCLADCSDQIKYSLEQNVEKIQKLLSNASLKFNMEHQADEQIEKQKIKKPVKQMTQTNSHFKAPSTDLEKDTSSRFLETNAMSHTTSRIENNSAFSTTCRDSSKIIETNNVSMNSVLNRDPPKSIFSPSNKTDESKPTYYDSPIKETLGLQNSSKIGALPSGSLFGVPSASSIFNSKHVFANLDNKLPSNDNSTGLFGTKNEIPLFPKSNTANSDKQSMGIFSNIKSVNQSPFFLNTENQQTSENKSLITSNMTIFGSGSDSLSFSTLAAKSSNDSTIFGSLANKDTSPSTGFFQTNHSTEFGTSESTWAGGSKLFSNTQSVNNTLMQSHDDSTEQNTEDDHDPHFQPIIALPPLVHVEKDEDNNDVLFRNRCKLYKFTNGEWKERGVGEMKILQSKTEVDRIKPVILLMRRDQVRKICCNQRITNQCPSFSGMNNDKSTCWIGNDFSEGEASLEQFAIKFADVEMLKQFKATIQKIQDELSSD